MDTKKVARDLLEYILINGSPDAIAHACMVTFGKTAKDSLLELFDVKQHDALVASTIEAISEADKTASPYRDGQRVLVMGRSAVIYETKGKLHRIQWSDKLVPEDAWVHAYWISPAHPMDGKLHPFSPLTEKEREEGWHINATGEQPVDDDVRVDCLLADGHPLAAGMRAATWVWLHHTSSPIRLWRVSPGFKLEPLTDDEYSEGWTLNMGGQPTLDNTRVDVLFPNGSVINNERADRLNWSNDGSLGTGTVRAWRYARITSFSEPEEEAEDAAPVEEAEDAEPMEYETPGPFTLKPLTEGEKRDGWILNAGERPPVVQSDKIDILMAGDGNTALLHENVRNIGWNWTIDGSLGEGTIRAWRPHR